MTAQIVSVSATEIVEEMRAKAGWKKIVPDLWELPKSYLLAFGILSVEEVHYPPRIERRAREVRAPIKSLSEVLGIPKPPVIFGPDGPGEFPSWQGMSSIYGTHDFPLFDFLEDDPSSDENVIVERALRELAPPKYRTAWL